MEYFSQNFVWTPEIKPWVIVHDFWPKSQIGVVIEPSRVNDQFTDTSLFWTLGVQDLSML